MVRAPDESTEAPLVRPLVSGSFPGIRRLNLNLVEVTRTDYLASNVHLSVIPFRCGLSEHGSRA